MKIALILARILVGLVFTFFGSNAFFHFLPNPPAFPGDAGLFLTALMHSGYIYLVGGTQVVIGILLLTGQFIPFALILLASMLANILVYHLTMMHEGWQPGVVITLLWAFLAWGYRSSFASLLVRNPPIG